MRYIEYNPNPRNKNTGDCVYRAIAKVTHDDWDRAFILVVEKAFEMKEDTTSNDVWNEVLYSLGFKKRVVPDLCPTCYKIKDFCKDNPKGTFIVATGSHVVAVIDGCYYDSWDSGDQVVSYYYERKV